MNQSSSLETLFFNQPWAILREKLDVMARTTMERRLTDVEILQKLEALEKQAISPTLARGGAVAVLPLVGVISQRPTIFSLLFGGTTTTGFSRAFQEAVSNPNIGTIVLEVDSPGGAVSGVSELASEILQARNQKRIIAVANSMAASAAYWIASAASEVVVTPGGQVGSIGVFTVHTDESKLNEKIGLVPTYISAGKYKVEANPDSPLSATARQFLQEQVNTYYRMFVNDVAKGRGVSSSEVINGFGEGRMVTAMNALSAGMVDRVATLAQVISRAVPPSNPKLAAMYRELEQLSRGPRRTSSATERANFRQWAELEQKRLGLRKTSSTSGRSEFRQWAALERRRLALM